MHNPKAILRTGFLTVLIISIILCSFTTGMVRQNVFQGTPFQTVPPVNATLSTPVGALTPVPTPIPTLGPGQYFEEGEQPEISTMNGDEYFGWGEIKDNKDLLLIWVTDANGTHYRVIEKDNEIFLGDENLKNGFIDYIGDVDSGRTQLVNKLESSRNAGAVSAGAAIVFGALLIFGPFGLAAGIAVAGVVALGESAREIGVQDQLMGNIATLETNLIAKFNEMK
jgi:hypothetical protein